MERKEPIKKNHTKEFGGRMPRRHPRDKTPNVPGIPGTFGPALCVNQYYRDRMSPGQTGHITGQMGRAPGTDGTHTRGLSRQNSLCLLVFFFPRSWGQRKTRKSPSLAFFELNFETKKVAQSDLRWPTAAYSGLQWLKVA